MSKPSVQSFFSLQQENASTFSMKSKGAVRSRRYSFARVWRRVLMAAFTVSIAMVLESSIGKAASLAADERTRGTGQELEICIQGEVFNPDGTPANNLTVNIVSYGRAHNRLTAAQVQSNRFSAWVPAKGIEYGIAVRVRVEDSRLIGEKDVKFYQIRQAVIEGLRIDLWPAKSIRTVNARVLHRGKPVPNALVTASTTYLSKSGRETDARTNQQGVATFVILSEEELNSFAVLTDDGLVGGRMLDHAEQADENVDFHDVQVFACRPLKIRLIDEDGSPLPDVRFGMNVSSEPSQTNSIKGRDYFHLVSDAKGEVDFEHWPDWPEHKVDLLILDSQYGSADPYGKYLLNNDQLTVRLRKQFVGKRSLATGQVLLPGQSAAGCCVSIQSYDSEGKRGEFQRVFADANGIFSAVIIEGLSHAIFLSDQQWVSDFKTDVTFTDEDLNWEFPKLTAQAGIPIEIVVSEDTPNVSLAGLPIQVSSPFSLETKINNQPRTLRISRWIEVSADESGLARAFAPAGAVEVRVGNDLYGSLAGSVSGVATDDKLLRLVLKLEWRDGSIHFLR